MAMEKKRPLYRKKGFLLLVLLLGIFAAGLYSHELAVKYFPDITCVACHEMNDPVKRWRESGVAKNHPNCADCHFDKGIVRVWHMNRDAVILLVKHFKRDQEEAIKPPEEPLHIDIHKEPGYYSLVPNHRCFQCKGAKNHSPLDQVTVHIKLIRGSLSQPCKDCHSHEMRNGMKFYEKILQDQKVGEPGSPSTSNDTHAPSTGADTLIQQ